MVPGEERPRPMVLNWGQFFSSRGQLAIWRNVWLSYLREYYVQVETRDTTQYPRMLRTGPQRIIQSTQPVVKMLRHSNEVDSGIE